MAKDVRNSPRGTAVDALYKWERDKAYADLLIDEILSAETGLDRRDSALAARIFYGTIQNMAYIDYILAPLSSVKWKKLHPKIRAILRTAGYQLFFLDRIPAHAAVSEAVELTRATGNAPAAGLVNAILRRAAQLIDAPPTPDGDTLQRLSTLYSHPLELAEHLLIELDGDTTQLQNLFAENNGAPPCCIRINTLKTSNMETVLAALPHDAQLTCHASIPNCAILENVGDIEKTQAYQQGLFTVQDAASQLAISAAAPMPGQTVLDLCAAPGGKSFAAAALMKNSGKVLAFDLHDHKIDIISRGAARLGISVISAEQNDATTLNDTLIDIADVVIADVPCSGLGIIRKKPDIRYKELSVLNTLPELQRAILENAARYVKPGGALLYSTCTLNRHENIDVIHMFLDAHKDFAPENAALPEGFAMKDGMLTLWPHIHHTDGFFFCKMRRLDSEHGHI